MGLEKREYSMNDMVEQDIKSAPSLDLPALVTERFYMPRDGGKLMVFFTDVRKSWAPSDGCPACHKKDSLIRSGRTKPRKVRDVVRNNHCVLIVLQSIRMLCKNCNQRFVPKIDGIIANGTMTERLVEFLKTESFLQPHSTLSERTGVSIPTIQEIMNEEIDRYEQMRAANPPAAPRVLGIDEKHITNAMRGTLVDVEKGTLLDMLENNSEETMKAAIQKLSCWQENIKVVTTDMANRYLKWLPSFLPDATIVIDKFHVIQDVQNRISTAKSLLYAYRKELIDHIEDDEERARQYEILRIVDDNRRLFNYSMENVMRDKSGKRSLKLNTVIDTFPEFRLLRMLYFYIEDMYTKETRNEAEAAWDEWQELLPPTGKKDYQEWCDLYSVDEKCFEGFKSFTRSGFTYFKPYILNYFNPGCRHTNAATEGLNNLIGSINISGNGYRFRHLRAKALYASLIHQRIVYSVDIKTITSWKPVFSYMTTFDWLNDSHTAVEKKEYTFRMDVQHGGINPTNVLEDNRFLPVILDASRAKKTGSIPDVAEDELINAACRFQQASGHWQATDDLFDGPDDEDDEP